MIFQRSTFSPKFCFSQIKRLTRPPVNLKTFILLLVFQLLIVIKLKKVFFQILHVKGIGFKVYYYWNTKSLYFNLGYNHICKYCLENIAEVKVRKQYLLLFTKIISLIFYVNEIKNLRFPDPYRGKGIRFRFQEMKFKPGKQR